MNNLYWHKAVNSMRLLAEKRGICNMVAAVPKAIEEMEEESIALYGDSHYEIELSKNRVFEIDVMDRVMNCFDLDENTATRFDRIEHLDMLIQSLNELKTRV
ncbi:MAG: hypothetical protein KGM99_14855 [Burkholderiales bacterium]|nr:hypothetical protein [Burkholderiales bacterium]